jgi:serine protease Do
VVNSSGFIVTNLHVISGARGINVLTYDRKVVPASFVGADTIRDIALLKIEGTYEEIELADSDEVQAGRQVIAIGNPLGLSFSVTEGIVSAVDRVGPSGFEEYIQTDVSLNPGNSGGPLIDTTGKVIGINNFKIGGAESLGFALESNSMKRSINLIANQTIIQ